MQSNETNYLNEQFFERLISHLISKLGYTEPIAKGFVSKIRIEEVNPNKIYAYLQDTIYQGFLPTSMPTIREVARVVWGDETELIFSDQIPESLASEERQKKNKKTNNLQTKKPSLTNLFDENANHLNQNKSLDYEKKEQRSSQTKSTQTIVTPVIQTLFENPNEKRLTAELTFENFVRGLSNDLAFSACLSVSEKPGEINNPLCIYGPSGLGKTHLLHAVGNAIIKNNPMWKVICISSEDFLNEYVSDSRHGRMSLFRQRFRSCDVLLVDDIQFLEKKTLFQQEFFHTFNDLFGQKKQIVITSDKYPKEIPELTERLKSRFLSGLIADIEPPGFEDRLAIIRQKAKQMSLKLSKDVAAHIASLVKTNVREIQGVLVTMLVEQSLTGNAISIEQVNKSLKHVVQQIQESRLDVPTIQKSVANYFGIKFSELMSSSRSQKFVAPRHLAMYLSKELLGISTTEIAEFFGKKDHTTVIHAISKIKETTSTDLKEHIKEIKIKLQSLS
jgi:chromosomal replication initiator protein